MIAPVILGLTGSIGMGKSTTAQMFRDAGIPVWDADATVEALYSKGGKAVDPIGLAFDNVIAQGAVDRTALKKLIARDPETLETLNKIVHPLLRASREEFIKDHAHAALIVLDVPLLFETGLDHTVDKIAVVTVSVAEQRRRVLDRGDMTEDVFDIILSRQLPDAEKRARADYIIETQDFVTANAAVARIIDELSGGK